MLELKDIVKEYETGNDKVMALRGVSIAFRESEFVAILGHSGCGKTTLLNIVGGLDQYTSGDLVINGVSTKEYKDRDWDAYRNHSVGFVFQSYNLIPHQTVLSNVEMALTISGVSKAERRKRATEALEQVGLGDQLKKKPNQMSGGQMQRVAIARALVNNPDILLADEPTGALDSDTSVQVMEILKEVAKDRLVIMVTHNPELAETYANRIVKIKDGKLTSDSNPYESEKTEVKQGKKQRVSMSYATAFSLSLNNLMTKKARTFLTAFAGSIGIIGIATILSLSTGINAYINQVQEDTLSSYPISILGESTDTTAMMSVMMGIQSESEEHHNGNAVYSSMVMYDMFNMITDPEMTTNNMKDFKTYLDHHEELMKYASSIQYMYDVSMDVYTKDITGTIMKSDFGEQMGAALGDSMSQMMNSEMSPFASLEMFSEMLAGEDGELVNDILKDQYDVVYGNWPQNYNEVVLIINANNELADTALYILGYKDIEEFKEITEASFTGKPLEEMKSQAYSYEDICKKTYKVILPTESYEYNPLTGGYTDLRETPQGMDYLYNSASIGTELKVVGIIRPNEDATATMLTGAVAYTSALTEHLVKKVESSELLKKQLENPNMDILTNLPFVTKDYVEPTDEEKIAQVKEKLPTFSVTERADIYVHIMSIPTDIYVESAITQYLGDMTRQEIEDQLVKQYAEQAGVNEETVREYISAMDDETLMSYVKEALREMIVAQYAEQMQAQFSAMSNDQLSAALDMLPLEKAQYLEIYKEFLPAAVSDSNYDDNLELLGKVDYSDPSIINIYASTFADKDEIAAIIADYNNAAAEENKITYTDYVALLMSSITDIISGISYLLIAFVAISLIVSSIMIGIITYISVLERTREIGILRAIGASKRDVSNVFNAETLIVGFGAGAIGIGVTLLVNIPINIVLHKLTNLNTLNAQLPTVAAIILIAISMFLTFIAGLIPARIAAKKDPVVALRSE